MILKNPRITEKATLLAEGACYTFDIAKGVSKKEVEQAIHALYKVTPRMVRTAVVPSKKVNPRRGRGKMGRTNGGRKAYVYLKKGDKIEVF